MVLRMPPHRAAYIGEVLDAYTRVSRLAGTEVTADERGFIKRYVSDGNLVVLDDNGGLSFETMSGHVVCLVYRPE